MLSPSDTCALDRYAQMFITPDEFDAFVERMKVELHVSAFTDERYVYVAAAQEPSSAPGESIRLRRPRRQDDALYLVQHDVRTDDPELVRLFDRMRRRWNRLLSRPVRATNVVSGGSGLYRDIGFTSGALELFSAGSKWRDEAASNIDFEPDESAPPPQRMLP
jgi:hypothetical protein